jgi:hypothetical protein
LIGGHHLLILGEYELILFKIDSELWQITPVFKSDVKFEKIWNVTMVTDQQDNRSFILYDSTGFISGKVIKNELVLSPRREFNVGELRWPKLVGFREKSNVTTTTLW